MTNSITKRNSNIELLRIISMLLVLVVHANFLSLSEPTHLETIESPIISFSRYLIQSLSIVCVNVFILISGYFGIRTNLKKISSLLYQVYFWIFFIHFILNVLHLEEKRNIGEWISSFLLFDYWFIRAYIILYIISQSQAFLNLSLQSFLLPCKVLIVIKIKTGTW